MNRTAVVCTSIVSLTALAAVVALGPLNPPSGAVSSTNKTLGEIEPRIAISGPTAITQPGSYYLTQGFTVPANGVGVSIQASNVTLDLNGFTISCDPAGSGVISSLNLSGIVVRNGRVTGSGKEGVSLLGTQDGTIDGLRVEMVDAGNTLSPGITGSRSGIVRNCQVLNATDGIRASDKSIISDCSVRGYRTQGITTGVASVVTRCTVEGTGGTSGQSVGIAVSGFTRVTDCTSTGASSAGFRCGPGSLVSGCQAFGNATGYSLEGKAHLIDSIASNSAGSGIESTGYGVIVEACTSSENGFIGLDVSGGDVLVRGCIFANNSSVGVRLLGIAQLTGNRFVSNDLGRVGVIVDGPESMIERNSFFGHATASISLTGLSSFNSVLSNTMRGGGVVNSGISNTVTPVVGIGSVSATTGAHVNIQY